MISTGIITSETHMLILSRRSQCAYKALTDVQPLFGGAAGRNRSAPGAPPGNAGAGAARSAGGKGVAVQPEPANLGSPGRAHT